MDICFLLEYIDVLNTSFIKRKLSVKFNEIKLLQKKRREQLFEKAAAELGEAKSRAESRDLERLDEYKKEEPIENEMEELYNELSDFWIQVNKYVFDSYSLASITTAQGPLMGRAKR